MCENKVSSSKEFAKGPCYISVTWHKSVTVQSTIKTFAFRFKQLLQVNLSKILSIDITFENLLAGYYRYSNANNNDATLLKALEVSKLYYIL